MSCLLCSATASALALCEDCIQDLPRFAAQVARPPRGVDALHAAFRYEFPIDRLIQQAKYRGDLAAARCLGHLMARRATTFCTADCMVPVPMPWPRVLRRGFNHAEEIAYALSEKCDLLVSLKTLKRRGWQTPQKSLSALARRENLRSAFSATESLAGRYVIVIDDVITTGATIAAAARALRKAGAVRVDAWVTAITL
ncbi:MAG: ComF family protein [Gammaproteobacteria bacterium]|nr:ComF family protein [Gammaproteobacteria bacterium]